MDPVEMLASINADLAYEEAIDRAEAALLFQQWQDSPIRQRERRQSWTD